MATAEPLPLITRHDPKSAPAEAYRLVRANLAFAAVDSPLSSLLVTSAAPAEGKTTTAANMAVTMAQAGKKVLLVDADLRRPRLHRIFQQNNRVGLTSVLVGEAVPEEAVRQTTVPRLSLVTSGPLPPNPSEMLGSEAMKSVLGGWQEGFDIVVIDSPPVVAVSDALVLATGMDGVVLVVKAGRTRLEILQESRERLAKAGARVVGVVLNAVRRRGHKYDYYYYYSDDQ